jgi:hypothetical protein
VAMSELLSEHQMRVLINKNMCAILLALDLYF